jgi:hypothetical protein
LVAAAKMAGVVRVDAILLDAEIAATRGAARTALENILVSSRGFSDSSAIN